MAHVYKNHIGRWYVSYKHGGKLVRYVVSDLKETAKKVLRDIQNEMDARKHSPERFKAELRGDRLSDDSKTFGWLVGEFVKGYQGSNRRGPLRSDFFPVRARVWLRHIDKNTPLSEITPVRVNEYISERLRICKSGTVRKEAVAMNTMFKWAKRRGLWGENPASCEVIDRPKESKSRSRPLNDEEYDRVMSKAPKWFGRVVAFACGTGLDRGVVIGNDFGQKPLKWDALNLGLVGSRIVSGKITFTRPKNSNPITQVLNDDALAALNEAAEVEHTSGIIFLNAAGQPVQRKEYEGALKATRAASGVEWFSFRTFRHTFATRAVGAGVHPKLIGELIGDSTAAVIERYMHTDDRMHREAAEKMSRRITTRAHNSEAAS